MNQNIAKLIESGGTASYLLYLKQNEQMALRDQIEDGEGILQMNIDEIKEIKKFGHVNTQYGKALREFKHESTLQSP